MVRDKMKQQFYYVLMKKSVKNNSSQMSIEKYNRLTDEVKLAKCRSKRVNRDYWLLRHYDVLSVDGKEKLISPALNDHILYYVPVEELFDILYSTHISISHGGRDRMRRELNQRYKNITIHEIQTFLNLCDFCSQKRKTEKKGRVVKPMVFSQFNSRCQVDLIDYQSQADGEYKFIMMYQDHSTKFVILRPLKSKKAEEVANHILNIFLLFGAPTVIQSDNGRDFCNDIIENLKVLWPQLKVIHGNVSEGSTEKTAQDVENMLTAWMSENKCGNWSKGLGFVQFTKNQALHTGLTKSPYEAMFGKTAKVGLASSNLRSDIVQHIFTEEDLEMVLAEDKQEVSGTEEILVEGINMSIVEEENPQCESL